MNLKGLATTGAAVSVHAVINFSREAIYAAAGETAVTPEFVKWMSHYGWEFVGGIVVIVIALQFHEEREKGRDRVNLKEKK
jgi:hypothetical protein